VKENGDDGFSDADEAPSPANGLLEDTGAAAFVAEKILGAVDEAVFDFSGCEAGVAAPNKGVEDPESPNKLRFREGAEGKEGEVFPAGALGLLSGEVCMESATEFVPALLVAGCPNRPVPVAVLAGCAPNGVDAKDGCWVVDWLLPKPPKEKGVFCWAG
jgi:hypothetical protein